MVHPKRRAGCLQTVITYCNGPPYYYKVAYEEAERMLERLKTEG